MFFVIQCLRDAIYINTSDGATKRQLLRVEMTLDDPQGWGRRMTDDDRFGGNSRFNM